MKRRVVHGIFGALVAGTALMAGWQWMSVLHARRTNAAMAGDVTTGLSGLGAEARFERARRLGESGDFEAASTEYVALIGSAPGTLGTAAAYNLGNLYLRQAIELQQSDTTQALPLLELAKQRFRDALRVEPGAWDARYNLERALRLAPEYEEVPAGDEDPEAPEDNVASTVRGVRMDLP